jgi:outer membrane protein assembly factor BamD
VLANLRVRAPVVFAVLASTVLLSGCAMFHRHKKAPEETYAERPVDQLYAAGAARLDHRQWSEGINYFKEVERQHPYSEWSRRAIMMQAYAHYEANQYDDAIADANRFIELYPGNASTAYAYYLKAECYFEQILDVGRDQAATEQALAAMREVARRYPRTEYAQDARLKIDMINDQLAGKEMTIGRWYLRQGDTLSAIGRFKVVVDKYQTTSDAPEALYRLVEAYLTLGLVDEAKRNAAVLGYNFPGDVWYVDAYKLMTAKGLRPEVEPKASHGLFHRAAHALSLKSAHGSAPPPPAEAGPALAQPETAPAAETPAPAADDAAAKKAHKKGWFDWLHGGKKDKPASQAPASSAPSSPAPAN